LHWQVGWLCAPQDSIDVFARVGDPVGSGFVESLAHPGGNLTGFSMA
jgi:ABC-type uncharacterized transport system substrate-binding protein